MYVSFKAKQLAANFAGICVIRYGLNYIQRESTVALTYHFLINVEGVCYLDDSSSFDKIYL